METLFICSLVAVCLLLIGRISVGVRIEHLENGLILKAKIGWVTLTLPKKTNKPKPEKEKKQKPEKKEPKPKPTIALLQQIPPIVVGCLRFLRKNTCINRIDLELNVADPDPVIAVEKYGQAHAVLGAIWQPLDEFFLIDQGQARVNLLFDEEELSVFGVLVITITIGQIIALACYLLYKAVPILKQLKGSE